MFSHGTRSADDIAYNGGYAVYYGYQPDTYIIARNVIDLSKEKVVHSYTDIAYEFMDSAGNVYCYEKIGVDYVPAVYKNGTLTVLKGAGFYYANNNLYTDGDSICTYENDTVYAYEKGVL